MYQMIETFFTPAHPDSFETWLNEPFAGTLYAMTYAGLPLGD
jgi:hypothetical protein